MLHKIYFVLPKTDVQINKLLVSTFQKPSTYLKKTLRKTLWSVLKY